MTTQKENQVEHTAAADMEQFQQTPYYQALGIEGLKQQLEGYQTGDDALRQQAQAQYQPMYDAQLEALRQQTAQQVQGYEAQLEGTGRAYERQRKSTQQAYDESTVNLGNALTKRGMGRSSLVSTQGAYLEQERNKALEEIDRDEAQTINAINERIALLKDQSAQSERTMAGNYARQLESRIGELKQQNQSASISLQLQIAALQQQGYEAYQKWLMENRQQELKEREFDIKYGEKLPDGSSAASSGGSKKQSGTAAKPVAQNTASAGGILMTAAEAARKLLDRLGASRKNGGSAAKPAKNGTLVK